MFFEGTLQEGLQAAVQQSKLVVSFVADGEAESQQWQEYLTDGSVAGSLADKAILLKLAAGSQEAGYLAALFPLPKTPTLVIMTSNGQLKDYIAAGTSKTDLLTRFARALGETPPVPTSAPTAHPQADVPAAPSAPVAAARTSVAAGTSAAAGASSSHETQLAERAARLAVQRQKDAEEAKEAARRRKEKGKAKADPDSEGGEGSLAGKPKAEARKAAQQLRQRQQEAAQERQRILRQIEHDRAERKARDERRRAERLAVEAEPQEDGGEDAPDATSAPGRATLNRHEFCSLQVRLFDGSNIRTRLPCGNNIRQDVRSWVDETRDDGRTPYTFRVIYPNRLIEETEEDKTLAELGLTPSATLVLVPVEKYATAYEDGDAGRLQRLVAFLRHLVHMIITFFTSIFSSPARPEEQAPPAQRQRQPLRQGETAAEAVQGRSSQIKGRRNANNAQRDYQLYNGNSLNFEPRPDDEEDDAS